MIPKIIHYCWFGRNPKPELAIKCVESWKKYCPDYELIEWNEDNFDITSAPLYVKQAYEKKKWAFVTDYVRLFVLYTVGGVYMDTDVEVIKSIDIYLTNRGFSGFEDLDRVPTGIMASEKGHELIYELMKQYETKKFILEDGTMNIETNVIAISGYMEKKGLILNNTQQTVCDFTFFPLDYFCPKNPSNGLIHITKNSYTIHHFAGSWLSDEMRESIIKERKFQRMICIPKNIIKRCLSRDNYIKLKKLFGR